ncbi:hypothetical protein FNV43_RR17502 [Rhamnella rubrinervis]|uniref:Serine hydrolase domain-containing protein n=1 Tax=Rhamnella rubrinervis TaxID=2594499 RepID=A0A8K0GRZ4_9ROSA|nr:hypothetical protein FNV43_RR17502 [Rhamnella rubrinervis]
MENQRKPRILCLHGFRTSADILKQQIGKWPETLLHNLDLVFLDGPFPAQGKSGVEAIFGPPYYEWFQANQDFSEYTNFEECLLYIEDYMLKHGPFDGFLGFSQGVALKKVPKIKFVIIISGGKFGGFKFGKPKLAANAFSSPIHCPSLHFIGETDILKADGIGLLDSFVEPVVIHHPEGHTVPRLDEKGVETMLKFIDKIQNLP